MVFAFTISSLWQRAATTLLYACGILLVWMAVFLYENDLGELINVLDLASSRVDRIGVSRLSWQARFVQEVARLCANVLDRLLGTKLVSLRSIGVTNCLSTASVCVVFAFMSWTDWPFVIGALGMAILFTALGITPVFVLMSAPTTKVWFTLTFSTALVWGYFGFIAADRFWGAPAIYLSEVLVTVPFSSACDIFFVSFTRWTLRWILNRKDFGSMLLVLVLNFSMVFLLVFAPLILWDSSVADNYNVNWTLLLLGSTNIIDGFTSGLIVFFALAMLLHRLFWPFLSRTVFGLKNLGILKWRKLLGAVGIALIASATPAGKEIVERIIEKLL
jgi:hypothetical protein